MASTTASNEPVATQNSMRRVAAASLVGTTVEFYDFFIFGTAAALVFRQTFFPELGDGAGTAASFATFGVAFAARPLGAMLFGHFGDRIGRKATLIASLLTMGIATFLVGCLPSANSIGVAAPILLIALRVLQGIAVGGEWAGAVLLTAENAPANKRGTYAMFPQLGPAVALVLTFSTYLITAKTMTPEHFVDYGWRIPFLSSAVMVAIGLYVRLKIEETAAFKSVEVAHTKAKVPLFEVAKRQPVEVLLAAGSITAIFAFFHTGATYLTSYATKNLKLVRTDVLTIGIFAGLIFAAAIAASAMLSDRVGRRTIVLGSAVAMVVWSVLLFPTIDNASNATFGFGMAVTLVLVGIGYGPAGAHLPELFEARYRYTGAGLAYSIGGLLGGGLTPWLADRIFREWGSDGIGYYLLGMASFSGICVFLLRETRDVTMTDQIPEIDLTPAPALS